jgi:hypothetical protein
MDRLLTWAIARRRERLTLVDVEAQIAERLLGRMEGALAILTDLGHSDADSVRAKLATLETPAPVA